MINLDYKLATTIDLAGRDVLEAVQTSVYPKVIDLPARGSGKDSLEAVAKNGVQLKVKARVTVRANLKPARRRGHRADHHRAGRARHRQRDRSAEKHTDVLANPDRISKNVLAAGLDSQTALRDSFRSTSPISTWETISAPACKPIRPRR